jgi:hypothetical protein
MVNVHTVEAPFEMIAGTGAQVPFTVPSSTMVTLEEELKAGLTAEDEEKLIATLLLLPVGFTGVEAEDDGDEDGLDVASSGSVMGAELEDDVSTGVPFILAEQTGSCLQAAVASAM